MKDTVDSSELLPELISAIRTINRSPQHEANVDDDEPCYWQRKEWIDWVLELADEAEQEMSVAKLQERNYPDILTEFVKQLDAWVESKTITVHEDFWPFLVKFIAESKELNDPRTLVNNTLDKAMGAVEKLKITQFDNDDSFESAIAQEQWDDMDDAIKAIEQLKQGD